MSYQYIILTFPFPAFIQIYPLSNEFNSKFLTDLQVVPPLIDLKSNTMFTKITGKLINYSGNTDSISLKLDTICIRGRIITREKYDF